MNDCAAAILKKAFHKISLEVHPDKNDSPNADKAFQRLNEVRWGRWAWQWR